MKVSSSSLATAAAADEDIKLNMALFVYATGSTALVDKTCVQH